MSRESHGAHVSVVQMQSREARDLLGFARHSPRPLRVGVHVLVQFSTREGEALAIRDRVDCSASICILTSLSVTKVVF